MKQIICFLLFSLSLNVVFSQNINWSEHIAPIIYENCSSCHHDGGIAPFNLMSYEETAFYGDMIHHVVEERSMPPWPADPDYQHFTGETYLTQWEIDAIHNWVFNGMPYGDEDLEPEPPLFPPQGSLLEQIDYTVSIAPYTLQSNNDEYRWFVIENPFDEAVYISQLEVIPGLEEVVHHADLFYDLSGNSLNYDQTDPLPGFNSSTGWPNNDYYVNAWQPGGNIAKYPNDWGIMIPPEAEFVIEIHYGPGGIGLTDSTKMNLTFVTDPNNVRAIKTAWLLTDSAPILTDGPLVIPANEVVTFHQERPPLAQPMSLISICPHMHWLGKSYRVWYETAAGDSIPLIDIPHWDFHWQKYYTFQQIKKIPAGAIIKSEGVYDNTTNNHDNLNDPPITVSKGSTTEDEMFLCYFIYSDYQAGDEDIVLDSTLLYPTIVDTIPIGVSDTTVYQTDTTVTGTNTLFQIELPYKLYPNPTKNQIILSGNISNKLIIHFQIINNLGQVVHQETKRSNDLFSVVSFDVNHLFDGIYTLEWWNGTKSQCVEFIKF